eukprot:7214455-Prymnesium_polylepis.1
MEEDCQLLRCAGSAVITAEAQQQGTQGGAWPSPRTLRAEAQLLLASDSRSRWRATRPATSCGICDPWFATGSHKFARVCGGYNTIP